MDIELKEDLVERTHRERHRDKHGSWRKQFAEKMEEHSPERFAKKSAIAQGHTHSRRGRPYDLVEVSATATVQQLYEFRTTAQEGHTADARGHTTAQGDVLFCWVVQVMYRGSILQGWVN